MWAALRNVEVEAERIRNYCIGEEYKKYWARSYEGGGFPYVWKKPVLPEFFSNKASAKVCIIEDHAFVSSNVIYEYYNNE